MRNLFFLTWLRPAHRIIWALLTLALLASTLGAQAQPRYQALDVTGYNADVVANGTNVLVGSVTTSSFDLAGYFLMERGYSNTSGATATQGLPPDRIINSAVTVGLPFQLARYSTLNSLRLTSNTSGTLTLSQPRALNTLYVLAATGSGNASMTVTVQFSDNTTQVFNLIFVPDWFYNSGAAISGLGRVNAQSNIYNIVDNPNLYQYSLALSAVNSAKTVNSVGITNLNGGALNVMGLSAESSSDLIINKSGQSVPVGNYTNITIQKNGDGALLGDITVNGALVVEDGGFLHTYSDNSSCYRISGPGSFTLADGGYLEICDAQGITASGATGNIQTTGARSFSTNASYVYDGTAAQVTGNGLRGARNLSIANRANRADVTLTQSTSVVQVLTLSNAGNLMLNGNALTLLSSADGTALVVNAGAGMVIGATATVQRYIDPSNNKGLGYRHYSAPISDAIVASLTTPKASTPVPTDGFTPVLTAGYNTSATPGTTTPFPTVFAYDQARLASATNNLSAFDKGFVVPAGPDAPLAVGQGYAVNIDAAQLVSFVGTLTTGDRTVNLARTSGATAADGGWALVGNPYPAPLDLSRIAANDRTGLEAAMYVFESSTQYTGMYRSYMPSVNESPVIGNSVLPVAQGFFVRVSAGQTSGSLTFHDSQRLTSPQVTPFQRGTAGTRPLVQLELRGATGPADTFYAYATAGATPAFDGQFDAVKLSNTTGLNLASRAKGAAEGLAIDARPVFAAATVLPLTVGVPAGGTYTLSAAALTNLPAGLDAYLHDAVTGQTINLSQQPRYAFAVSPAQAQAGLSTRFSLGFSPQGILATHAGLHADEVSLFPNPAHASFTVLVPAVTGTSQLRAELLNSLGQVVRRLSAALPADGTSLRVDTAGLAEGVYSLRLYAGPTTLTKRVVLQ